MTLKEAKDAVMNKSISEVQKELKKALACSAWDNDFSGIVRYTGSVTAIDKVINDYALIIRAEENNKQTTEGEENNGKDNFN